ncbi:MAG: hypothetical protein HGA47_07675 [Zoogloea sp.]|nr:hypothetical protein [Zoogloea sp.]
MLQQRDEKGYVQLGGAGEVVAKRIHAALGYKVHFAVADYLQRAARHLASATDVAQAVAVGEAAVEWAVAGESGVMITLDRTGESPYRWETGTVALEAVANLERRLPPEFIRPDGFGVTEAFRRWCRPLLHGESWPPFARGLPDYRRPELHEVEKRLPPWIG